MSNAVVVVGPKVITGQGAVDPELVVTALECVDEELALVDDQVVRADDLWQHVLGSAVDGSCDDLVVICPSWWAISRLARVRSAAGRWSVNVVVLRRVEVLAGASAVVEVAPELVVVHADGQRRVIARANSSPGWVDAVVACVEGLPAVTIDVPCGVALVGADLARALRNRGVDVTLAEDRTLLASVRESRIDTSRETTSVRRHLTPRAAAVTAAILTASALTGAAVGLDTRTEESDAAAWLVEGHVAVEVPAEWTVELVTSGPGSARVQVVSPSDRSEVIHVTQARVPETQTLDSAAEVLRSALAEEPEGVFIDFTAPGERAQRAAVTYREVRADRRIDWTVLLDGGVRIAIGCQGSGERSRPELLCDRAIRSAHAVARN